MSQSRSSTSSTDNLSINTPVWESDLFLQMQRIRCALPQYDWQPKMPSKTITPESNNKKSVTKPKRKRSFEIKLSKHSAQSRASQFKSRRVKTQFFAPKRNPRGFDKRAKVELPTPMPKIYKGQANNSKTTTYADIARKGRR